MFQFIMPFIKAVGVKAAGAGITKAVVGKTLLKAGVSAAASAILSKSADNRPQTTTTTSKSRTNFQEMRDDAIAAGYNPLTALRMTGGAGNVTTTGTSVINTPALSSRAILGRAIGAGLNSLGNSISSYDPLAQKQKELNIKLAEQQLRNGNRTSVGTTGLVGDNALVSSGIDPQVSIINPAIHLKDNVVNDDVVGTTTTRVMPDGALKTAPAGEDFDEILLNGIIGGSYMTTKGLKQIWNDPSRLFQSGVGRLPNIPTLAAVQSQKSKDQSVFTQMPVLRRTYDTPAATIWRDYIKGSREMWGQ
jgi:hypothetical protein